MVQSPVRSWVSTEQYDVAYRTEQSMVRLHKHRSTTVRGSYHLPSKVQIPVQQCDRTGCVLCTVLAGTTRYRKEEGACAKSSAKSTSAPKRTALMEVATVVRTLSRISFKALILLVPLTSTNPHHTVMHRRTESLPCSLEHFPLVRT